ncbi:hypothetical protein [Taklimakanibacter lacteus]|uniref:hypothetical protein n=1 Tax=Taklimakanibacter lacteus TaxID=2268456 RepID=UPI000E670522
MFSDVRRARSTAIDFFLVFFLCLSIALANGFPLYTPDSDDYAGWLDSISAMRSPVPGLVSLPLYALIGAWALPVISSAMIACLVTEFCDTVLGGPPPLSALSLLLIAAGVPIFASFIMPDIWVLTQVAGTVILLHRWRTPVFVMVALSAAGHGANLAILLLLLPVIALVWPSPRWAILVVGSCLAASIATLMTANLIVSGKPFPETYAWSITASKMMNDIPETVEQLCKEEPGHPICGKRQLMNGNVYNADDYYVWFSDLSWVHTGGLARAEFTDLGKKLFMIALMERPLQLALATGSDWIRAYDPARCFGAGYIEKKESNHHIHFLVDQDHGTLARLGWLSSPILCKPVYFANTILLGAALALSIVFFPILERTSRATLLTLWFAFLANDFVFSLLSGMWTRYTVRAYGILALVVLVSLMARRRTESIV